MACASLPPQKCTRTRDCVYGEGHVGKCLTWQEKRLSDRELDRMQDEA